MLVRVARAVATATKRAMARTRVIARAARAMATTTREVGTKEGNGKGGKGVYVCVTETSARDGCLQY